MHIHTQFQRQLTATRFLVLENVYYTAADTREHK